MGPTLEAGQPRSLAAEALLGSSDGYQLTQSLQLTDEEVDPLNMSPSGDWWSVLLPSGGLRRSRV